MLVDDLTKKADNIIISDNPRRNSINQATNQESQSLKQQFSLGFGSTDLRANQSGIWVNSPSYSGATYKIPWGGGGTITSYSPSWTAPTTNPAIGNGTLLGRYLQSGDLCVVVIEMLAGSTTTFGSGEWKFSLPVNANNVLRYYPGTGYINDTGTANYNCVPLIDTASSVSVIQITTRDGAANLSSAAPMTWTNGDKLSLQLSYFT